MDINEELLKENEYLHAELQVFKAQLRKINKRPGFWDERKLLHDIASIVTPATILRWHRQSVAKKFNSSKLTKRKVGRPRTLKIFEDLILKIAFENSRWGYTRIFGTIRSLGFKISRTTVANILERNGIDFHFDVEVSALSVRFET